MKEFNTSLFIFRRDLRLDDNTGLIEACKLSSMVIPAFILDPRQIGPKNKYRTIPGQQFMFEALQDLHNQLRRTKGTLYLFSGIAETVVETILKNNNIEAVFVNRDYTPFSRERDEKIKEICHRYNRTFMSFNDLLLHEPEEVVTAQGTTYRMFTPYFKKSKTIPVRKPMNLQKPTWYFKPINLEIDHELLKQTTPSIIQGKKAAVTKILKKMDKFQHYHKEHNIPSIATTYLSAYLKFGICSIRQAYWSIVSQLGQDHDLIRQLHWRDFFTHIAYNYPFVFERAFHEKYARLPWENDKKKFKLWCHGKTGFPIVDAGMRQLNETGFMHNRVRMIVASFLVKDLHIDWRWGERYFAQTLRDYDPAVNNGNWQWSASTGCDSQPYFRIFNPWLQQKKFDPHAKYIKTWVAELKNESEKTIHNWYKKQTIDAYPKPIINHTAQANKAKKLYKRMQ